MGKEKGKLKNKILPFIIVLFGLIAIYIGAVIFVNNDKVEISFKNQVEEYVQGNYIELGLEKTDDYVILTAKELYSKGVIDADTYKDNENSVIKITLNANGDVSVKVYNKDLDNTNPIITLLGSTSMKVEYGSTYTDPGYKAIDDVDGNITENVLESGTVDTNALGVYVITYSVSDSSNNEYEVKRTVQVVDTKNPTISLNGKSVIYVEKGKEYNELGATAIDNVDNNLSSDISINGTVNVNKTGTYTVTYTVSDFSGNITKAYRNIIVIEYKAPAIYLKGDLESTIIIGAVYTDPGVLKVTDEYDNDLINKVTVTGTVDTTKIGTYKLVYKVTNSKGVSSNITRTVNVVRVPGYLANYTLSGAVTNITIPGMFDENYTRTFTISDVVNQYNESMDITNSDITWNVTSGSGVSIQDNGNKTATLSISNSAVEQEITVTVVIGGVEKTLTFSLVKTPILASFEVSGTQSIDVKGNENTTSLYEIINAKDQYGEAITIDSNDITWSLLYNEDSNISISSSGLLTMNKNVDLTKTIIIKAISGNTIFDTLSVTLSEINVTSIDLLDSELVSKKNQTITLGMGAEEQISASITPTNATLTNGVWTSSDQSKVTVVNGLITVIGGSNNDTIDVTYTLGEISVKTTILVKTSLYYNSSEGVNAPQLVEGMTPIKWNGTAWVNTTVSDPDWYSYTNADKKWANAQTADGSFWVWIPRYVYKITSGWNQATATPGITVQFSMDYDDTREGTVTLDTGTTSNASNNKWTTHPAFTFGTDEIPGFWVAKFEAAGSVGNPKFAPNLFSLHKNTIETMWNGLRGMETNSVYGWGTTGNGIDTHMIKNIEWGAVAYLIKSEVGKGERVWINNSQVSSTSLYSITGCAGDSATEAYYIGCKRAYDTPNGMQASTTGNIYGVYDMSGGNYEIVAAYVDNAYVSTYGQVMLNADSKYKDVYSKGIYDSAPLDMAHLNYFAAINKKGDALYETSFTNANQSTSSWDVALSLMAGTSDTYLTRGGGYLNKANASPYVFLQNGGYADSRMTSRGILIVKPGL